MTSIGMQQLKTACTDFRRRIGNCNKLCRKYCNTWWQSYSTDNSKVTDAEGNVRNEWHHRRAHHSTW